MRTVSWKWSLVPVGVLLVVRNAPFIRFLSSHLDRFGLDSAKGILAGPATDLFWGAVLVLACLALGRLLLPRAGDEAAELPVAAALGMGVVGLVVLAAGLTGLLAARWAWRSLALALAALHLLRGRGLWRALRPPPRLSPAAAVALSVTLWALVHGLLVSLAPPVDWDTVAYHLALPKLYVSQGALAFVPWMAHACYAMESAMQAVLGVLLRGDVVPSLTAWCSFALLVLCVARFASARLGGGGLLSAALLCSLPVTHGLLGTPRAELLWALFGFCALRCLDEWGRTARGRWLFLAGALGGCCAGTKYLGWGSLAGLSMAALFQARKARGLPWARAAAAATALAAVGLAAAMPWYIRNVAWTGNPVWPFLGSVFPSRDWDPQVSARLYAAASFGGAGMSPRHFLSLPIRLLGEASTRSPSLLLAPLAALAVFRAWSRKPPLPVALAPGLLFACFSYASSFFSDQFWRYFFPAIPVLCLWLSWLARRAWLEGGPRLRWLALAAAVPLLPALGLTQNNQLYYLTQARDAGGLPPREAYLRRALDIYPMSAYANETLGREHKVLLFEEIRGAYLNVPYVWGDPLNQARIRYDGGPEATLSRLRAEGITHVLVNEGTMYPLLDWYYTPATRACMSDILSRHASLVHEEGRTRLYRLL